MKPLDLTLTRVDYIPYFAYTDCGGNIEMAERKLRDIEATIYFESALKRFELYKVNTEDYKKFKGEL